MLSPKRSMRCHQLPESAEWAPQRPFSRSKRAICSAIDNFLRQPVFRQSRQRSSEHHWHWRQSGQGCFFSMSGLDPFPVYAERRPGKGEQPQSLAAEIAGFAEFADSRRKTATAMPGSGTGKAVSSAQEARR